MCIFAVYALQERNFEFNAIAQRHCDASPALLTSDFFVFPLFLGITPYWRLCWDWCSEERGFTFSYR